MPLSLMYINPKTAQLFILCKIYLCKKSHLCS